MNNEELVLKILAETSPLHIRKLARLSKLNPNTIINITTRLAQDKILTKTEDPDTKRILIDFAKNERAVKKKINYTIDTIYDSGLITYLEDYFSYPTIFLFGSFAKGENHETSDIDLFIITEDKKDVDVSKYEQKLSHEVQLFIHTPKEFRELCKSSKELINNVLNGIKLSGYIEIFR